MNSFRKSLIADQAAKRLQAADRASAAPGTELFIAASGGYGKEAQRRLLYDIRALYEAQLGEPNSPGFDAA